MGSFYWRTLYMFFDVKFPREDAHHTLSQETQLSLTNRATRLELLTFENTVTFKGSLKVIGNVTIRYSACDLLLMFKY